ncbi:hypothetical protein [Microbacterium testaceum]|uniref:hypothetical protein n=1 Tax=Microbacterium testaceum TaxID=2033 RepID=UPI0011AF6FB1|nr:hypothetical protein [Microbacterium testaceum]
MKFLEAVAEIETLPDIDSSTSPYFLTISRSGRSTSAFITLMPHNDGTWTATIGDLRDGSEIARDDGGAPLIFADEDAACRWAVAKVRRARSKPPTDPEKLAQAMKDGDAIERRFRQLEEVERRES